MYMYMYTVAAIGHTGRSRMFHRSVGINRGAVCLHRGCEAANNLREAWKNRYQEGLLQYW